jgi:hypothetical protein
MPTLLPKRLTENPSQSGVAPSYSGGSSSEAFPARLSHWLETLTPLDVLDEEKPCRNAEGHGNDEVTELRRSRYDKRPVLSHIGQAASLV